MFRPRGYKHMGSLTHEMESHIKEIHLSAIYTATHKYLDHINQGSCPVTEAVSYLVPTPRVRNDWFAPLVFSLLDLYVHSVLVPPRYIPWWADSFKHTNDLIWANDETVEVFRHYFLFYFFFLYPPLNQPCYCLDTFKCFLFNPSYIPRIRIVRLCFDFTIIIFNVVMCDKLTATRQIQDEYWHPWQLRLKLRVVRLSGWRSIRRIKQALLYYLSQDSLQGLAPCSDEIRIFFSEIDRCRDCLTSYPGDFRWKFSSHKVISQRLSNWP